MTTYESGKESSQLDDIITGRLRIEGRLNRGKFAEYKVGDQVWLRRDYRDDHGILHDGPARQLFVDVTGVRHYSTFAQMLQAEDFKKVIPYAADAEEALGEFNRFYTTDEQEEYGVIAIELAPVDNSEEI